MRFTDTLFNEVKDIWDKYLEHPFVNGIGKGTLDKEKFKEYLIQDYLYLNEYAKVYAIGFTQAKSVKEMKFYFESMAGAMEDETAVHIDYLKSFGLTPEDTEKYDMGLTNSSYTSYMLSVALKGNNKEIAMATMPCAWSYYYIGKYLIEKYSDKLQGNYYKPWIEEYASSGYKSLVDKWIDYINDICSDISEEESKRLKDIFVKSSLYELEFWNMSYK